MNSLRLMPALPYAVVLIAGIVAACFLTFVPFLASIAITFAGIGCGFLLLGNSKWRACPLLVATFFMGMALMTRVREKRTDIPQGYQDIACIVVDAPRETDKNIVATCRIQDGRLDGRLVRLYFRKPSATDIRLGATYEIRSCLLRPFVNFRSDGNFNYERWAECRGFLAQAFVRSDDVCRVGDAGPLPFFARVSLKAKLLRERVLRDFAEAGVEGQRYAIVAAMAFGDKSGLSQSTKEAYSRTGAAHLLALSGMHLGILFIFLSMVFVHGKFRLLGKAAVIVMIWAYVILVGMSASVVRAATMLTIYTVTTLDGRNKMSLNALFVTASLMLLFNPLLVWDISFQLSFLAMLSIFIYYTPIYNLVSVRFLFNHPLLRKVWAMVALSVAAQLGTMPLTVYYFGRLNSYFILTNLIAIPLVTILLHLVCFALVLWMIPFIKPLLILLIKQVAWLLNAFLVEMSSWRGVSVEHLHINWMQLWLLYAIIAVVTVMFWRVGGDMKVRTNKL